MISQFHVLPHYSGGTQFRWQVDPHQSAPKPWVFYVEESHTGVSDFHAITDSTELCAAVDSQACTRVRSRNRATDYYFRVVGQDGNGALYTSDVVGVYGQLTRREYLLARDMLRREAVTMGVGGAGVPLLLYRPATGAECTTCRDPVSGAVVDPKCPVCGGTGHQSGFQGPYHFLGAFTPTTSQRKLKQSGAGVDDDQAHLVRCLCVPPLQRDDVLIDTRSDRGYTVQKTQNIAEVRRTPIIQEAQVSARNPADKPRPDAPY